MTSTAIIAAAADLRPLSERLEQPLYLIAALLMIVGLRLLGRADTARQGNLISAFGMVLGVAGALISAVDAERVADPAHWEGKLAILLAVLGAAGLVGFLTARWVKMTGMPELVALFNGLGGLSSLLLAGAGVASVVIAMGLEARAEPLTFLISAGAVLVGGACFSGSLMAWGKLSGRIPGKPLAFHGQTVFNVILLIASFIVTILAAGHVLPAGPALLAVAAMSLIAGITIVVRVGGADMPIVVSLLNSFSGVAAAMAGFAVGNSLLVVAGALVGASGLILTQIMTKAMNSSLGKVLLGGAAAASAKAGKGDGPKGEPSPISPEDAFYILEAARSVVVVPGYGLAVAQAQHAVKELADLLDKNGADVRYAIHPVAGRMPGHMNVLLAEANVPYEALVEPDDVNPSMEAVDVAIVVGANDVVNPDAKEDPSSPLYGMPIIEVDRATTTIVLKRSMATGFSGVENALFYKPNTRMLFGDAKASLQKLASEFKGAS